MIAFKILHLSIPRGQNGRFKHTDTHTHTHARARTHTNHLVYFNEFLLTLITATPDATETNTPILTYKQK
jgi:hypothetical protein